MKAYGNKKHEQNAQKCVKNIKMQKVEQKILKSCKLWIRKYENVLFNMFVCDCLHM